MSRIPAEEEPSIADNFLQKTAKTAGPCSKRAYGLPICCAIQAVAGQRQKFVQITFSCAQMIARTYLGCAGEYRFVRPLGRWGD